MSVSILAACMMRGLSLTNQLFKYQRAHSATQAVKPSLPCPSGHSNQRETIHQGRLLTSITVTITIVIIIVTRILQNTSEMVGLGPLASPARCGGAQDAKDTSPSGLSSPVNGLPADSPQGQVRPQRDQRYLSPAAPRDGAASLRSPVRCPASVVT